MEPSRLGEEQRHANVAKVREANLQYSQGGSIENEKQGTAVLFLFGYIVWDKKINLTWSHFMMYKV